MGFKVAHNLHPLGARKQMMHTNTCPSIHIDTCPCCQKQPETQLHMFTCDSNPNRNSALVELTIGGSTYKEFHQFVMVMTDCIEQWLSNPNDSDTTSTKHIYSQYQINTIARGISSRFFKVVHHFADVGS